MSISTATSPALADLRAYLAQLDAQDRVSATIRVLMRLRGESQAEVARRMPLERSLLSNRLRGRSRWTSDDLDGLAAAFDLQVEDLFGRHLEALVEQPGQVRYEALAMASMFAAAASALDTTSYRGGAGQAAAGAEAAPTGPYRAVSPSGDCAVIAGPAYVWVLAA